MTESCSSHRPGQANTSSSGATQAAPIAPVVRVAPAARIAWCLYNFGVAAWPVVIATFVWGTYFSTAILRAPDVGAEEWGEALSGAGFVVAVLGPVLGAIADRTGRRKPWLAVFAAAAVAATALLWFSVPEPSAAMRTLVLVAFASIAYEFGLIFYNAMLRDLVPLERLGRLSGWGWGLGYVGGLACLTIALFALVKAPSPPFGLGAVPAGPVRATALLVALWFALFTLPLFFFVPDRVLPPIALGRAVGEGLKDLGASLRGLMRERNMLRFLLARMIYADGLNTLFIFGGIYAAGEIGLSLEEVIRFAILINASAGAGALLLAWLDDWIGSKPTIVLSLAALVALGGAVLAIHSKPWFWGLGIALGVFVGPAQASSRALMARMVPPGKETEMFGLYALSGTITAFVGPALYGVLSGSFASQRAGMAVVVAMLALGLALLLTVRAPGSSAARAASDLPKL
ncbi:MAG TPA: MFS transporter [Alphaproteobacteria bacterium]|nr:MFS transporter [Alphaproteobacteria bacterium]